MSEHRRLRAVIVGPSNLGPYHLARFNALVEHGLDLRVACCPIPEHHRPWTFRTEQAKFEVDFPFGKEATAHWRRRLLLPANRYLEECQPDIAVFVGYNSPYLWAMGRVCRRRSIPASLWLISWAGGQRRPWLKELAKSFVSRYLFTSVISAGIRSALYAESLGFRPEIISRIGNVVDNDHFAPTCDGPALPPRHRLVYVGRLSAEKNLLRLLDAYARYRARGGEWELHLYGDGPLRDEIRSRTEEIEGASWEGWIGYEELPSVLYQASALILPSITETWGLVVNEIMAVGRPVLVTRWCGCYPELARDGVNGFGFDPTRIETIADAIECLSNLPDESLEQMGRASRAIISSFSLEMWCNGFIHHIRSQVASGR